jgi:GTP-binding protein EngB required for normal cell division
MIIKDATFITSVADKKGFLKSEKPIIAVAGKSNVGKSTFININLRRNLKWQLKSDSEEWALRRLLFTE